MSNNCPGFTECWHPDCLKFRRCWIYGPRITYDKPPGPFNKHIPIPAMPFDASTVAIVRKPWKRRKGEIKDRADETIPTCSYHEDGCNKQRACRILGSCLLEDERLKGRPELWRKVSSTTTKTKEGMKAIVKILSIIVPALNRMGVRNFYKPETFWGHRKKSSSK